MNFNGITLNLLITIPLNIKFLNETQNLKRTYETRSKQS
jgi:hypothetical protein